jgi:Flp pilus assembly pilin Flp
MVRRSDAIASLFEGPGRLSAIESRRGVMSRLPTQGSEMIVRRGNSRGRGILLAFAAESGQEVVEYGILIATIAILVLIGAMALGNQISPWLERLAAVTTLGA